jgi:hypothetical protein
MCRETNYAILRYSYREFSCIQYINEQKHLVKYNKIQIIKHSSYQVPTPTCFGTKKPSSESLITINDRISPTLTLGTR